MAKKKHPGGRPRKLKDAARRKLLLSLIRRGIPVKSACHLSGICHQTLRTALEQDAEFAAAFDAAHAARIKTLVEIANKHMQVDPRTALHLLACACPEYRKTSDEPTTHVHNHIAVANEQRTLDQQRVELARIIAALREREGTGTVEGTAQPTPENVVSITGKILSA